MTKLALNKNLIILVLILLLAFFLRVVAIDSVPRAIYGDGLTLVYDAYSILKTGHDQKGHFLPFIFELGDHRPPGYVYGTLPFVALFGPTVLGANGLSIVSSLGILILLFLLGQIFYSARVGLIAAFLGATSPWEISLSRGPFETHFACFLGVLAIYSYFKSQHQPIWLVLTSLSFAIASLTYPTYGLISPLLFLLLLNLYRGQIGSLKKHLKIVILAGIITLSGLALSLAIVHSGNDPSRVESINIFNQDNIKQQITQDIDRNRKLDTLPGLLSIGFHNRFWEYLTLTLENYIENFRPIFLLISGDGQPRHNPASGGEIYWATLILFIGGIVFLYGRKNMPRVSSAKVLTLLLIWILIVPIATAIVGPPHALRDSMMLPAFLLLMAFGGEKLLASHHSFRKPVLVFIVVLYLAEFIFFIDNYYFVSANKYAQFWAYAGKQASEIALREKNNYQYIILSSRIDSMEFAFPVYAHLDPQVVIAQNQHGVILNGYKFLKYDNIYIGSVPQTLIQNFLHNLPGSYLYLAPEDEKSRFYLPHVLSGPNLMPDLIMVNNP